MKNTIYLLLSALLLLVGCATSQTKSDRTVFLEKGDRTVNDTSFLYAPRVIVLETKDDALIARINRVMEWNQKLYILDKAMKQIVTFNMDGKHLFTIHRVGNGKGEYNSIIDAAIDKKRNQLLLLTEPSSLLRFDVEGNFIDSRKLPGYYHSIAADGDFIYLENETFSNEKLAKSSITVINKGQESELLEPLKEIAPYCFIDGHQLSGSSPTLFTRKFDDTIYKLEDDRIISFYSVDFAEETFPKSAQDKRYDCHELNRFTETGSFVYLMTDLTDASNYLLFRTNLIGGVYVLSKSDNVLRKYNHVFQTEYSFNLHKYTPIAGEVGRVCFVSAAETLMSLKSLAEEYPQVRKKTSPKMLELLNGIQDDSNPVLFYYRVK